MFDISKKMDDRLVLNGKEYQLFLSFDNVLKVFDMWSDDKLPVQIKPQLALVKFTNSLDFKNMDFETALNIYSDVFDKHIKSVRAVDAVERYDLEGNVIPRKPRESSEDGKPLYSIKYDGEFIFSSFMQAYHIDLIEEQGKLHWSKFNALLAGLPEGTKLIEVMKIRAWRPQRGEDAREKQRMRALQEEYALPD